MSTEEKVERVRVKAIALGYYEHLRRRKGVIFDMGTDMKVPVDPNKPDGPKRWPLWVVEVDKNEQPIEPKDEAREPMGIGDSTPKATKPGKKTAAPNEKATKPGKKEG